MTVQPTESILIVDFGSQVTQLIARRIREAGVYSEIAPFSSAEEAFNRLQPKGVIFSGGPASVTEAESPRAPQLMFDSGLPLLAICYGQQTLHQQLGGKVVTSDQKEFGRAGIGHRARQPDRAATDLRQRAPAARHLLWPADASPAARRQGRHVRPEGVRPGLHRNRVAIGTVRWTLARRREAPGLDEPRRPGRKPGTRL